MKTIVISRAHLPRVSTYKFLQYATWVVHTKEMRSKLLDLPGFSCKEIIVSGVPEGPENVVEQRDWIEMNLLKQGEWYIGADDNITGLEMVDSLDYFDDDLAFDADDYDRDAFKHDPGAFISSILNELARKCYELKTIYGGFGFIENPFFRLKKWQLHTYVKSKLFVKMVDGHLWRWDKRVCLMHDHALTYDIIARYGCAPVNQWLLVKNTRWEKGGLGTIQERMPYRIPTCEAICERFAGLVKMKHKKEGYDDPCLCRRGQKSIDEWRKANGYIPSGNFHVGKDQHLITDPITCGVPQREDLW